MSYNIILNSSHSMFTNGICNVFKYNFPQGNFFIPEGSTMSLTTLTIPYSWYNISSYYGNNSFSYEIPSSSGFTYITVIIDDGFYTITDLNKVLSKSLYDNNFFFYNNGGNGYANLYQNIIYPIQFSYNSSLYTNSIIFQYIPTTSQHVMEHYGSNWVWANSFPLHACLPRITIPQFNNNNISQNTYGLGNILGFTNGVYPSSSTLYYNLATTYSTDQPTILNSKPVTIYGNSFKTYTYTGANNLIIPSANPIFSPIGSLTNGIIIRCNLIDNSVCIPSDVLDSIPITSEFGSNINYIVQIEKNVKIKAGLYNCMYITFSDQNFNALNMQDPNILINILIKIPK